jgi:EpsI family protein
MGNIMIRMGIVIGVLVAVQLGFFYVGHLAHPTVIEPQVTIGQFPMVVATPETGTWQGKEAPLDNKSFTNSEASDAVSRLYTKDDHVVKFLLAEYQEPSKGLYHNPMNCYYTQGFTLVSAEQQTLKARNRPDATVSVTTWKKESEKVIVVYWYEVGDRNLFERQDLLATQWAMVGKTQWPVMFKVLLEIPAGDGDQSKSAILDMAQYVRGWLGDEHVKPLVN